jgi:hypothetical protein
MVQLILRYKVWLTDALYDYCYCHIKITNCGRGITITDLPDEDARKIIHESNLELASTDEYDFHDGKVYHDGKFKKFVNSHPDIKKNLIKLIDKTDLSWNKNSEESS